MPELPEVETTRRGIAPFVVGHTIKKLVVRERRMRWPVPAGLEKRLQGQRVHALDRRAKYLLFETPNGYFMLHLGMSGSLRVVDEGNAAGKHDHVDVVFDTGKVLRFNDPRRFGSLLWLGNNPGEHPLLAELGPEPLGGEFSGEQLFRLSRKRKCAVKNFIMDNHIVVGVGNIYASEALFASGIRPGKAAGRVSRQQYDLLAAEIVDVLSTSIKSGGTTLRDFVGGDGKPGYFQQRLRVYGRDGEPCHACGSIIKLKRLGQRSSFYCPACQS